jgi:hypothetical protein
MMSDGDDKYDWPHYAAWTVAIAFFTAIATKTGEWVVEAAKNRREKKP